MLRENRACRICYEDATRMLATFRRSHHVKMVGRIANMLAISRACRARAIRRMTRQTGKENKELAWAEFTELFLE